MRQLFIAALFTTAIGAVNAQTPAPAAAQKSLAATLNVYVFPGAGQAAAQQSKDETECYNWAVQNTGNDPFKVAKDAEQQKQAAAAQKTEAQQATKGAGAKSAVKGAAAGAIIGEVADDDAGKGAAIGATAGVVAGRRKARAQTEKAEQTAAQQTQAATQLSAEQTGAFNKAFSACLEAKKYTVKY